jgi:hypothetical protein
VAVRWLSEPSPWRWPPEHSRAGAGAGAGPSSADAAAAAAAAYADGVEAPFGPHFPPGAGLHWVRPGALVAAAITRQGTMEARPGSNCLQSRAAACCKGGAGCQRHTWVWFFQYAGLVECVAHPLETHSPGTQDTWTVIA